MITYKDIKNAINTKISKAFPSKEIIANDVSESFPRPSFFVKFDNVNSSSSESQRHRFLTVRITYFPSNRYDYSIEILEMLENLEKEFDLKLAVLDRIFTINDVESSVTDGVLHFDFDIEYEEGKEIDNSGIEIMQNLVY